jgi:hypothetical protein
MWIRKYVYFQAVILSLEFWLQDRGQFSTLWQSTIVADLVVGLIFS